MDIIRAFFEALHEFVSTAFTGDIAFADALEAEKPQAPAPVLRFLCGVPNCNLGIVTEADSRFTVVECDEHNSRTIHDTQEPDPREQKVINIRERWSQYSVTRPRR